MIKARTPAWSNMKRMLKEVDIPTQDEVLAIGLECKDQKTRALFFMLYLTGARRSEVLNLRPKDVQEIEKDGRPWLKVNLKNVKHRTRHRKEVVIPLDNPLEKQMASEIILYWQMSGSQILFQFSGTHVNRLISKHIKINPHYLRHVRLTHLVTVYDFNEQLLIQFAGWTDSRPSKNYMALRWQDFTNKM